MTRPGISNSLLSAAGDDRFGNKIADSLRKDGVDLHLLTDPAGTERPINLMDASGGRISIFATQSSEQVAIQEGVLERLIETHKMLIINMIAYCRHWIPVVIRKRMEI